MDGISFLSSCTTRRPLQPSDITRLATDISRCVANDQLVRAKLILKNLNKKDRIAVVSTKVTDGNAPLFLAAQIGNVQFVNLLLDEGHADIEQHGTYEVAEDRSRHQVSPLWCAAVTNRLEVVRSLTRHGADVNAPSDTQSTPVRSACYMTNVDIVRFLVDEAHADIHRPNMNGGTCLINSVQSAELCRFLIERGADVNAHDNSGNLAMHYAIREGRLETVRLLLKSGSDAYVRNDFGDDALQSAALRGYGEILEFLIAELSPGVEREIEAYELMGTNSVDEKHDVTMALLYWEKAMRLHCGATDMHRRELPPNPAYCNAREPQTIGELHEMGRSTDRVYMHALVLRERILGTNHKDTIFGLMYRGAVYADTHEYQRCVDLWKYAFALRHARHQLLTHEYLFTLQALCKLFWEIFDEDDADGLIHSRSRHEGEGRLGRRKNVVRFCDVYDVFEMTVKEVGAAKSTIDCSDRQDELLIMLQLTLHLVHLLVRLKKNDEQSLLFKRLVHQLVRIDVRLSDGRTLLRLAADRRTSSVSDEFYSGFPSSRVVDVLVECGADVGEVDTCGDTVLHAVARDLSLATAGFTDSRELTVIARTLIAHGAHVDCVNSCGVRAAEGLGQSMGSFDWVSLMTLKCYAARVIKSQGVVYKGVVPKCLDGFIAMH